MAFKDINPQAPIHVIIIPKQHIESVEDLDNTNVSVVADIVLAAKEVAKALGVNKTGYRLINNCGKMAGQSVFHLHFHLLAGKEMSDLVV